MLAIPLKYKLPMAVSAATSAFCWFTALALGTMATLKTQSWGVLGTVFGIEFALGIMVAVSLALWARVPTKVTKQRPAKKTTAKPVGETP